VNSRTLFGIYFRQQAELAMPDMFGAGPQLQTLVRDEAAFRVAGTRQPRQTTSSSGHTATPASTAPPPKLSQAAPSSSAGSTAFRNRLSALRPVSQLVASAETRRPAAVVPPLPAIVTPSASAAPVADKRSALAMLYRAGCSTCHLATTRKSFVFGAGNAEARVMVIGEAPGHEEDLQGLPFVGPAGKLLTTMLAAIDLDRTSDVFITNILKCRPPGNRNPESAEIITCMPLLRKQIDIIRPAAILLLGRIAAHAILDITESISKMRTRVFNYNDIPCMVIYHPAALLRNAEYKRPTWEDLKLFQSMLASMGIYGSLRKE